MKKRNTVIVLAAGIAMAAPTYANASRDVHFKKLRCEALINQKHVPDDKRQAEMEACMINPDYYK